MDTLCVLFELGIKYLCLIKRSTSVFRGLSHWGLVYLVLFFRIANQNLIYFGGIHYHTFRVDVHPICAYSLL
jgi:hypothetical protein